MNSWMNAISGELPEKKIYILYIDLFSNFQCFLLQNCTMVVYFAQFLSARYQFSKNFHLQVNNVSERLLSNNFLENSTQQSVELEI